MHFIRATVWFVNLIDNHNWFEAQLNCFAQYKTSLRHWTFKGIHQKENAICHFQNAFYFSTKVGVTWSIDDVDLGVFVPDRYVFGNDGDTAFPFQIVVVQNQILKLLIFTEDFGCVNDFIHESSFTMIDVGDDGYVSNCLHIAKNGRKSTVIFRTICFLIVKI